MPKASARGGRHDKAVKKTPKKQIEELTDQNTQLATELDALRTEAGELRVKLGRVTGKLLSTATEQQLEQLGLTAATDPLAVGPDQLDELLQGLVVVRRLHDVSVEARADDLEKRVTDISFDVARKTMKMMAYETHFDDIMKCTRLEEVRDKVYNLRFIAGQEYHSCQVNDPLHEAESYLKSVGSDADVSVKLSLETAHKLNLHPPEKRYPGNTHINEMHGDLKLYIMKELSYEKPSGADWRRLAERVGIASDLIDYWSAEKVSYAGARVFDEWSRSPAATVRILHRHLMSPQMRCTILGKSVSNFYDVD